MPIKDPTVDPQNYQDNSLFVDKQVEIVWSGDKGYPRCSKHLWYFSGIGKAPIGNCEECWRVYWFGVDAMVPTWEKADSREMLLMGLEHLKDELERGTWDFKPKLEITIEKEEDNG